MLRSLFVIVIMSIGIVAGLFNRFAALLLVHLVRPVSSRRNGCGWTSRACTSRSILGLLLVIPSLGTGILPDLTHPISIGMILFLLSSLLAQLSAVNAAMAGSGSIISRASCSCRCSRRRWSRRRRRFVLVLATGGRLDRISVGQGGRWPL